MEDTKNIKDNKKQKGSPELKEELTEDDLKGLSGGMPSKFTTKDPTEQSVNNWIDERIHFLDPSE